MEKKLLAKVAQAQDCKHSLMRKLDKLGAHKFESEDARANSELILTQLINIAEMKHNVMVRADSKRVDTAAKIYTSMDSSDATKIAEDHPDLSGSPLLKAACPVPPNSDAAQSSPS